LPDLAAMHREASLGLDDPDAWLALPALALVGGRVADACGLLGPLPPGVGEIDFTPIAKLPVAMIYGPPCADQELAAAIMLLGALPS
jgi:hypothetical protein